MPASNPCFEPSLFLTVTYYISAIPEASLGVPVAEALGKIAPLAALLRYTQHRV